MRTTAIAAARDYGAVDQGPGLVEYFRGRSSHEKFRGYPSRSRRLLRLRRALSVDRLQFSRHAAIAELRGGDVGRAVVLGAAKRYFSRRVPAFPRLSGTGAGGILRAARRFVSPGISGAACRKNCAPVICRRFCPTRMSAGFARKRAGQLQPEISGAKSCADSVARPPQTPAENQPTHGWKAVMKVTLRLAALASDDKSSRRCTMSQHEFAARSRSAIA